MGKRDEGRVRVFVDARHAISYTKYSFCNSNSGSAVVTE